MSSLRVRIVLALLAVVLLAVGAATFVSLGESSRRLEADQRRRSEVATSLLDGELRRLGERLDREVARALDPRGDAATLGAAEPAARWLWASARLEPGVVDVLTVLDDDGQVLTSGHWPASLGARDPAIEELREPPPGTEPQLRAVPVPHGSEPVLARWGSGRWGSTSVVALAGRFVGPEALDDLRERAGADLLALCSGTCLVSRDADLSDLPPFQPDDPAIRSALRLDSPRPGVWVGVDQRSLGDLVAGVRLRALSIAAAVALLALGVGVTLSRRIVRPVEALSEAAGALARGDRDAAERLPPSDIAEVQALLTAFQAMGRDLERSREELVQAERVAAWREIARGLAHELKNPLTPIQASMDVIRRARALDRPDFDDILAEQAGAVVEEVRRLKELADSFARFARLPEAHPEPLEPCAVLDQVLNLYVPEDTPVERDYPSPTLVLSADQTQLQTALTNLVKNAVEAASDGDTPRLRVSVEDGEAVRIVIEDSGPGIAPEVADRLFTPYVTTKGSRGTGLGLALVHRIALEHGGAVRAERSEILGGARFVLTLPRSV